MPKIVVTHAVVDIERWQLLIPATAVAASPVVTRNPTTGPPTTVSGTGFGASETVDVYFDTTDIRLTSTSASGTGSLH
jgi:hypothetical protein